MSLPSLDNPAGSDIILTGVPRAGTTLAYRLLNGLESLVALNEPIDFAGAHAPENWFS